MVGTHDNTGRPTALVALTVDPVTGKLEIVPPAVISIAPEQSSFAGGGGGVPIQISKVVFCNGTAPFSSGNRREGRRYVWE